MLSKGHSSVMRAPSARARVSLSRRPLVKVRASFSSVAPLGSRILVRIEKSQPQSAGGILLPSSSQKKQNNGVVVSISEDVASVTKGDKVLYSEYAGTEVDFQDEEHIILKVRQTSSSVRFLLYSSHARTNTINGKNNLSRINTRGDGDGDLLRATTSLESCPLTTCQN